MTDPPRALASLQELQRESGKRLPDSIITGMTSSLSRARYELIRARMNPSGAGFITEPTDGTASLQHRTQSIRKLMTLPAAVENSFTHMLNTALLGGTSYPILTAVLGTMAGEVSTTVGLIFTVADTALTLSRTSPRVLARPGDELWQIENIGKSRGSGIFGGQSTIAVHVGSYFLVDPYRSTGGQTREKGWLIHEERTELTLR